MTPPRYLRGDRVRFWWRKQVHGSLVLRATGATVTVSTPEGAITLPTSRVWRPEARPQLVARCAQCGQPSYHPFHAPRGSFGGVLDTHDFEAQYADR